MNELTVHPEGEERKSASEPVTEAVAVDTFGGRIHVEWDPQAAVTRLGQLPFFVEFLKVGNLFELWLKDCPLSWSSPNGPRKPDVLGDHRTRYRAPG